MKTITTEQPHAASNSTKKWSVYIVECADGSLYTGVTTDVARRIHEHNHCNKKAAKYTRCRRPVTLRFNEQQASKVVAYQREWEVKQLTKRQKEALIAVPSQSSLDPTSNQTDTKRSS